MITRAYWVAFVSLLALWAYTWHKEYQKEFSHPARAERINP